MIAPSWLAERGMVPCLCGGSYKRTPEPWSCGPGCGQSPAGSARMERALGREGGVGSTPTRQTNTRFRATATMRDGMRFRSKVEAALYDRAVAEGWTVLAPPRFPLRCLWDGVSSCPVYTPDLFVLRVAGEPTVFEVEAWEAKGPKALESRDYVLRAAAFRSSHPLVPLRVFRRVRGQLVEDAPAVAVEGQR